MDVTKLTRVGFVTGVFPLVNAQMVSLIEGTVAKFADKRFLAGVYELVALAMPRRTVIFLTKFAPIAFGPDRGWAVQHRSTMTT